MSAWDAAIAFVLEHEGGSKFTEHPKDPGGATKYGISLRFAGSIHFDLDRDGETTRADIMALTLEEAKRLYRTYFWNVCNCDELPAGLAIVLFDNAVNQGVKAATRILQRSLLVKDDGAFGPITLRAAIDSKPAHIDEFTARRNKRYAEIGSFETFGLGWMRRSAACHRLAVTIGQTP